MDMWTCKATRFRLNGSWTMLTCYTKEITRMKIGGDRDYRNSEKVINRIENYVICSLGSFPDN